MPGCWQDWNGLEEVTEVTAFWGEGIGRNSHTLKLQELGGHPQAPPLSAERMLVSRAVAREGRWGKEETGVGDAKKTHVSPKREEDVY